MAQGAALPRVRRLLLGLQRGRGAPEFIGPTALVKAYRYALDARDVDEHRRRLADLSGEHGLWECMRCYFCSERCPKHLRVRELIAHLGELA